MLLAGCSLDSSEDTPSPSPSGAKSTKPSKRARVHSTATFDHFKVTVSDLKRRNASEVRLLAKVCVRSLPPDPQGNRTRISWDPWAVRAKGRMIDADKAHTKFKGAFPPDHTYRKGQCAEGWVPFFARGTVTKIKYANGVGDVAVWDADHLGRKPEIRAKSSPAKPKRSAPPKPRTVHPGAYCEPRGATGVTTAGTPMVCTSKGPGTQPRWRQR
jgi:hypothetical protein